jgi:hypothetical protein
MTALQAPGLYGTGPWPGPPAFFRHLNRLVIPAKAGIPQNPASCAPASLPMKARYQKLTSSQPTIKTSNAIQTYLYFVFMSVPLYCALDVR